METTLSERKILNEFALYCYIGLNGILKLNRENKNVKNGDNEQLDQRG